MKIQFGNWVHFSVLSSYMKTCLTKLCSKIEDSLGDRMFRKSLEFSLRTRDDTITHEFIKECCTLVNEYNEQQNIKQTYSLEEKTDD